MFKVGIVTTTVREGRVGVDVAEWVKTNSEKFAADKAVFEVVDLGGYNLPTFASTFTTEEQANEVGRWVQKMTEFDAYIFVVAEYNHGITGAIKNASEFLKESFVNKAVSFVGYGGLGGIRAIENFRVVLAEHQAAAVQKTVNFLLAIDFENYSKFAPKSHHDDALKTMLDQLLLWSKAFSFIK